MKEFGIKEHVEDVLNRLRPSIWAHGGDVELIDVTDGVVRVILTGACATCSMSSVTLKETIETVLKKEVPGIKEVKSA